MHLTDRQTDALADRFDQVALWVASALDLDAADDARSVCQRLDAVCRLVREQLPDGGNDARLMLHIVAALQAAIETRAEALSEGPSPTNAGLEALRALH